MKWAILAIGSIAAIGIGVVIIRKIQTKERADAFLTKSNLTLAAGGAVAPAPVRQAAIDAGMTRDFSSGPGIPGLTA